MSPSSEERNPATMDIDVVSTEEAVAAIVAEDAVAIEVVSQHTADIARAVEETAARLEAGGAVGYFGAGASGRIGMLDATELGPTFGVPRGLVTAHFPGGDAALVDPAKDHEDAFDLGLSDAGGLRKGDVAVGLTASGRTPYVDGALTQAREVGALSILITCAAAPSVAADVVVALPTGPEAITGSTRLKAGTATKSALNAFSTALMVRLGRTYSNLMTGVTVTNEKLQGRAVRIVREVTDTSEADAQRALEDTQWRTDHAIVALLSGSTAAEAERALAEHHTVRRAVDELKDRG